MINAIEEAHADRIHATETQRHRAANASRLGRRSRQTSGAAAARRRRRVVDLAACAPKLCVSASPWSNPWSRLPRDSQSRGYSLLFFVFVSSCLRVFFVVAFVLGDTP